MIDVKKFHSWSTTTFVFKIEDLNEAILFPSWLEHGVGINVSDSERISIAANFLIGE